jgi:preprotein translocase subunit SecG
VIYLLYTLHVLLCIFLILVVLLQQGKGADLSVFGGGSTMAAFGARSATTLLHRLTVAGFVGFVLTTLLIAFIKGKVEGGSVMKSVPAAAPISAPATPAPAAPVTPGAPAEAQPGGGSGAPTTPPQPQ